MKVGDLVRYKHDDRREISTSLIGIVIRSGSDDFTIEVEWNDGERHVYYEEHKCFLEVIPCK